MHMENVEEQMDGEYNLIVEDDPRSRSCRPFF
jgi:hypothetical protein